MRLTLPFRGRKVARPAAIPPGMRVYAVGDIHGRFDLLQRVEAAIAADRRARPVAEAVTVFLGDYVDRGPASRQVLDHLSRPPEDGMKRICLKGNHEEVLLAALGDPGILRDWRDFGGFETLYSYGVAPPRTLDPDALAEAQAAFAAALPPAHLVFLRGLAPSERIGGYFFVHAGIDPARPLAGQDAEDLTWIREPFLSSRQDFGCVVVHGHTPVETPEVRPNRIGIDTGAYLTGRLTCLVLEGAERRFLPS